MTPEEFNQCVSQIGWSLRAVSQKLNLEETRVRRWASGHYPVPKEIAQWLKRLAAAHRLYPAPALHLRHRERLT
jgi:hypothetical protein